MQRFLSAPFLFVAFLCCYFAGKVVFSLLFASILVLVVSHELIFFAFSSSNFLCPCIIFRRLNYLYELLQKNSSVQNGEIKDFEPHFDAYNFRFRQTTTVQ